jgi:hypothetical protein
MEKFYVCQNCNNVLPIDELKPIKHAEQRIEPGEIMPAGECPQCGGLCHQEHDTVFVTMDGGLVQNVIGLPPGLSYEVIDWEWLKEEPHDAWERCTREAKQFIKETEPDLYKTIKRALRRKPRATRKAA